MIEMYTHMHSPAIKKTSPILHWLLPLTSLLMPFLCAAQSGVSEPIYPACEKPPIVDAATAERHGRCLISATSQLCAESGDHRFQISREEQAWKFTSTPTNPGCPTHTIVFRATDGYVLRAERSVRENFRHMDKGRAIGTPG